MELPVEILEYIITKIDTHTYVALARSSKLLRALVIGLARRQPLAAFNMGNPYAVDINIEEIPCTNANRIVHTEAIRRAMPEETHAWPGHLFVICKKTGRDFKRKELEHIFGCSFSGLITKLNKISVYSRPCSFTGKTLHAITGGLSLRELDTLGYDMQARADMRFELTFCGKAYLAECFYRGRPCWDLYDSCSHYVDVECPKDHTRFLTEFLKNTKSFFHFNWYDLCQACIGCILTSSKMINDEEYLMVAVWQKRNIMIEAWYRAGRAEYYDYYSLRPRYPDVWATVHTTIRIIQMLGRDGSRDARGL